MKSAKEPLIPVKTIEIPYIHPKLQLSHLRENGKLFSDLQIRAVQNNEVIQNTQGRITKAKLNEMFAAEINNKTLEPFTFSLQRAGDSYSAIYKGQEFSLGSGSFGSVKLLQNLATSETSEVLKVLKTATDTDVEKEKIGLQKAQQFKSVHKRTPDKNQHEIVMDAAKGCSLDKLIGKKLPTVAWIDIIINVLKETKKIHSNNLLHRDLKPENINYDLISKKATVLDFGLATSHTSKKELLFANLGLSNNSPTDNLIRGTEDFPLGTVMYMSMDTQRGIYNEKTEIHALGLTFANLLNLSKTERGLFVPTGETDLFLAVQSSEEATSNAVITDTLTREAILRMLQDMTKYENNLTLTDKPGYTNIIDYFSQIREEYIDTLGLTHNIAYLNIADYLNADDNSQQVMLNALTKTDEVWLLDINGEHRSQYLAIQKALEYKGINVNYSVIQSDENNAEQVMRHYAEQREVNDRNIYECSYIPFGIEDAKLDAIN